jgi:hypothetical protein
MIILVSLDCGLMCGQKLYLGLLFVDRMILLFDRDHSSGSRSIPESDSRSVDRKRGMRGGGQTIDQKIKFTIMGIYCFLPQHNDTSIMIHIK